MKIIDKKGHSWRGPGNHANAGGAGQDEGGGDSYTRKGLKAKGLAPVKKDPPSKPKPKGKG
jgi:hypothetical protein